jgi:hypothetical protein
MITGDADNMQIMGAADDVQIMGLGADPALVPAPTAPWEQTGTQTAANAAFVSNQHSKNLSTTEKIGAVGAVLLVVGAVFYSMHKKG